MTDAAQSGERYVLRLFVTGSTPRSVRAIENLRAICEAELPGRYELEVVDVYLHPEAAKENQVIAAPTLLKLLPTPVRRVIGDLTDHDRVRYSLDIVKNDGTAQDPFASFGGAPSDKP
ncbi:circadian clock KaiB family protein [Chenggangzhangella methanolivorans]|uniref:Circadian clock KaiB family protein n=1 Tax=Chenggangzhangella methanolivorans TaxID=1437009 RepID=A0A9E6RDU4_9HYPH|nr:circadian clock KaiB family protein [Chenggangzhangella methanolivorans]QZN99285.1 circadian clock KaiB family protein [Chenggangzhangella methanolivorans]